MVYDINALLTLLTSGSSLHDLAGATPEQIEARLAEYCVIYDTAMVEHIECAACDLAAEMAGL